MGIFEKDIPEDLIERYPELYSTPDRKHPLSGWSLVLAEVLGVGQGALVFLFVFYAMDVLYDPTQTYADGFTSSIDINGMLIVPLIVGVVLGSASLRMRHWTVITIFGIVFSYFLAYMVLLVLNVLFCPDGDSEPVSSCGIVIPAVLGLLRSWLVNLLVSVAGLLPELCFVYVRDNYFPSEALKLQAVQMQVGDAALRHPPHHSTMTSTILP